MRKRSVINTIHSQVPKPLQAQCTDLELAPFTPIGSTVLAENLTFCPVKSSCVTHVHLPLWRLLDVVDLVCEFFIQLRILHYICFVLADCIEGDIRLASGAQAATGRVEVCYGETWGTICDSSWTQMDANVACRQLGFSRFSKFLNIFSVHY